MEQFLSTKTQSSQNKILCILRFFAANELFVTHFEFSILHFAKKERNGGA